MSAVAARANVRGACPGALRPMASGDGLIVRVRPHAATLSLAALRAIADAARTHGNGHIDLTRRANLQVRGVTEATLARVTDALAAAGLLDPTPEIEARRNIVASPLAGIDPSEIVDVRPLAAGLETELARDRALAALPVKFGFLLDGGGRITLAGVRADVHFVARATERGPIMVLGVDRPGHVVWLGATAPRDAAQAAARVVRAFLDVRPGKERLRDLGDASVARLRAAAPDLTPPGAVESLPAATPIGVLREANRAIAVGFAAAFGRLEAEVLLELARAVEEAGADEVRLSPWRSLYAPVTDEARATALLGEARRLGLIVEGDDRRLAVEACPGAPACRSASLDTRRAAERIARNLPALEGVRTVHVSGCPKGCACSAPADLVLVGNGNGFSIVRNGRADAAPGASIAADELDRLPDVLLALRGGRHG